MNAKPAPPRVSLETRIALMDFYQRYADLVDSGVFEAWHGFFTDDCTYRVIARENHERGLPYATVYCDGIGMIRDRANALRDTTAHETRYTRHLIGPVTVDAAGPESISSRASFAVFESLPDAEPHLLLVGTYVDRVVGAPDNFRFQERWCVYDNFRIQTSLIYPI